MTELELDKELVLALPTFIIGSWGALGVVSNPVGVNLAQVVWSSSGIVLSVGAILQLVALAAVIFNRDKGFRDMLGPVEAWIAYATMGFVIAPPIIPHVADAVQIEAIALPVFFIQTAGFVFVSMLN
ncbi:hypothetical protein GCM10028857_05080 [Salinarchaeum chitinilyticum]